MPEHRSPPESSAQKWKVSVSMTQEELENLLEGEPLNRKLDVKTLVLDIVRELPEEALLNIFWDKLPELSRDYVKDYLYMKRS